jgi:ABC-type branched-subunit amino acid transport system ATPase component
MNTELLKIEGLSAGYGGRPVLEAISLTVSTGERLALIGPNGCGKSTLLRTITAEVPESAGVVRFRNEDITDLETDQIVNRGIAYLRQTRNVFPGLTVDENIGLASSGFGQQGVRDYQQLLNSFPILRERGSVRAGLLSGGERQALATAMALMRPVSLLILDEPVAGLSQKSAEEMLDGITSLQRTEGFAVVVVEHRLRLIRPHVDRVVVMVKGTIREDTRDTSLLESRERLEKHYSL